MYFDQVYCSELKLSDQSEAKCKTAFVLVPTTNYITINYTFLKKPAITLFCFDINLNTNTTTNLVSTS